ncbi:MAG: hypothetical protein ACI4MI_05980 [Christensenellales bacterium]
MRYAVVDVGSNSVRLMLSQDGVSVKKIVTTTGLGRGLATTGKLNEDNMAATLDVFDEYRRAAEEWGAQGIYFFATEAVRKASNREEFLSAAKRRGTEIEVLCGDVEAEIGFLGAYTQGTCCVVDIGGASTEIAVGDKNGLMYSRSLPIGLAVLNDKCGEDVEKLQEYVADTLQGYGKVPAFDNLLSIGGTSATFVAMQEQMVEYDAKIVDMYRLNRQVIVDWCNRVHATPQEQRTQYAGLEVKRRDLIVGGGILLVGIMDMLGQDSVIVRDRDNLEGYLQYKTQREGIDE